MGGAGNTGMEPEAQKGLSASSAAPPIWTNPAAMQAGGATPAAALSQPPPALRPFEEQTASAGPATGLLSPNAAAAVPSQTTNPANLGFGAAGLGKPTVPVPTMAAAPAPAAAASEAPKEFAAPTSFRPIYEATSEVNTELSRAPSMKRAESLGGAWINDPELSREWLQAIADHGGDWRLNDQYYNPVHLQGNQKIYWPGDPARPK